MAWDIEIDARDLLCPLPVLRLRKRLQALSPGQTAHLLATDPMAQIDVPHFCAEHGHDILMSEAEGALCRFVIRKGPGSAPQ